MRLLAIAIVPLTLAACASADSAGARAPSDTQGGYTDSTTSTTETYYSAAPTDYALDGLLELDEKGTTLDLQLTLLADDGSEVCSDALLATLSTTEVPKGEPIVAWWDVELDASASSCDPRVELLSSIGVGAWDPRLDVPLVQQGFDGATTYALYVQAPGEPVWVVGLAGTEDQLAGTDAADPKGPLADGTYTLATLVRIPLP